MAERTHPDPDDLVALALGHADGDPERLAEHLAECVDCSREYDEYAASIALLLPATPPSAPPADFPLRVADRLRDARAGVGVGSAVTRAPEPSRQHARGAVRGHRWWLPAAAAIAGVAIGAGAVTWWAGDEEREPPSATEQWQVPLSTADGQQVGSVARSYGSAGPVLVLEVSDGPAGQRYTCRLVLTDGSTEDVAEWQLADDRPNSWVIETQGRDVVEVQLVTLEGRVWSSASL